MLSVQSIMVFAGGGWRWTVPAAGKEGVLLRGSSKWRFGCPSLAVSHLSGHGFAFRFYACQQAVEGVGEGFDAGYSEVIGDLLHGDACVFQFGEDIVGLVNVCGYGFLDGHAVHHGFESGRGNGVHCVFADEGVYVEGGRIVGVFGGCACPEWSLHSCAHALEISEVGAGEDLEILLIGDFAVGDGSFSEEVGAIGFAGEELVYDCVDAADEEGRDGGDLGGVFAAFGEFI